MYCLDFFLCYDLGFVSSGCDFYSGFWIFFGGGGDLAHTYSTQLVSVTEVRVPFKRHPRKLKKVVLGHSGSIGKGLNAGL